MPMRKHAFILVALLLGLAVPGSLLTAQDPGGPAALSTGRLEGAVRAPDGRPLAGARVLLRERNAGRARQAETDADGYFAFPDLLPGAYELSIEQKGFAPLVRGVEVRAGETGRVDLRLALAPLAETLIVTATRGALGEQKLGELPAHVTRLGPDELARAAAWTLDDLLRRIPSFSLFRRTSSLVAHPTTQGVTLRGLGASGASRTLVLLDGIPLNDAFGNWVQWSKVGRAELEAVEVAEGSLSPLYGSSALAGVIELSTRPPEPAALDLDAQAGSQATATLDLAGSYVFGPLGLAAGGAVFRTGGYRLIAPALAGAVDTRAAARYARGYWRADYAPASRLQLTHTGRYFAENRSNGTPLQANATRALYLGGSLQAETPAGLWRVRLFGHRQTFRSSFSSLAADRSSESLTLLQAVPANDFGLAAQWSRRLGARHELTAGLDTRWIGAENRDAVFAAGLRVRDPAVRGQQLAGGFFFQDLFTPVPRLRLQLGVRLDGWQNFRAARTEIITATGATTRTLFPRTAETTVTPQAGWLLRLHGSLALRGAFYQGFRAPTLNELYRPFRVGNVETRANERLGPERLTGGEVGVNFTPGQKLFWRVTAYWNLLRETIANVTLSATPTLIVRQRQNLGRARARGLQSELVWRASTRLEISAAHVFSEALVEAFPADPLLVGRRLPQVPRHRASLRLTYLDAVPSRIFRIRDVHVELMGRYESARFDDDRNLLRLGSFFTADLTLLRPLGERGELFLAVENLLNRRYAVQATPVELAGTPRLISAGLRLHLRRR